MKRALLPTVGAANKVKAYRSKTARSYPISPSDKPYTKTPNSSVCGSVALTLHAKTTAYVMAGHYS